MLGPPAVRVEGKFLNLMERKEVKHVQVVVLIACVPLTMCDSLPSTRHYAVTQLDDLGNADYLLGVVTFIRQQHQEEEYVGNDGLRISVEVHRQITYVANTSHVLQKGLRHNLSKKTYLNCPTSMYSNCFKTNPMNTWNTICFLSEPNSRRWRWAHVRACM